MMMTDDNDNDQDNKNDEVGDYNNNKTALLIVICFQGNYEHLKRIVKFHKAKKHNFHNPLPSK